MTKSSRYCHRAVVAVRITPEKHWELAWKIRSRDHLVEEMRLNTGIDPSSHWIREQWNFRRPIISSRFHHRIGSDNKSRDVEVTDRSREMLNCREQARSKLARSVSN